MDPIPVYRLWEWAFGLGGVDLGRGGRMTPSKFSNPNVLAVTSGKVDADLYVVGDVLSRNN